MNDLHRGAAGAGAGAPDRRGAHEDALDRTFDTLGMVGSGALITTGLLLGLRSFQGTGELFGPLGRVLESPLEAARTLLERAGIAYRTGPSGQAASAGDMAKAGVVNQALGLVPQTSPAGALAAATPEEALHDDIRRLAAQMAARRQGRAEMIAQMLEADRQASLAQTRTRLLTPDDDGRTGLDRARHAMRRRLFGPSAPIKEQRGLELLLEQFGSDELPDHLAAIEDAYGSKNLYRHLFNEHYGKDALERAMMSAPYDNLARARASFGFDRAARLAWRRFVFDNPGLALDARADLDSIFTHAEASPSFRRRLMAALGEAEERQARRPGARGPLAPLGAPPLSAAVLAAMRPRPAARQLTFDLESVLRETFAGERVVDAFSNTQTLGGLITRVQSAFAGIAARTGYMVDTSLEMLESGHEVFRVTDRASGRFFDVPLRGADLTYRQASSAYAYTAGLEYVADPHLAAYFGRRLANPEELVLAQILEQLPKIEADVAERGSWGEGLRQISRITRRHFSSRTTDHGSPFDVLLHATRVRLSEAGTYDTLRASRQTADESARALMDMRRLRSVMERGQRFAALDLEFTSGPIAKAAGVQVATAAGGRLSYQFSASVFEGAGRARPRFVATLGYMPRLFSGALEGAERDALFATFMQKQATPEREAQAETLRQIYTFQEQSSGFSDGARRAAHAAGVVEQLKEGQLFIVTDAGMVYYTGSGAFDAAGLRVERAAGETMEHFFLRVQNAFYDTFTPEVILGHASRKADFPQVVGGYAAEGLAPHPVLAPSRQLDTYEMTKLVFDPATAKGLQATVARLGGLTPDEDKLAKEAAQMLYDGSDMAARTLLRGARGAVRERADAIAELMLQTGSRTPHEAGLDAAFAGHFLAHDLYRAGVSPHGETRLARASDMLRLTGATEGQITFATKHFAHLFGNDDEGGLNAFFETQAGAASAGGSLLRGSVLPLFDLLSPLRQRYQDLKPKALHLASFVDGRRVAMGPGGQPLTTPARLLSEWMNVGNAGTGLAWFDVPSELFAGYDLHTKRLSGALGEEEMRRFATSQLTAFVEETDPDVWESQFGTSRAVAEAHRQPAHKTITAEAHLERLERRARLSLARREPGLDWQALTTEQREVALLYEMRRSAKSPAARRLIERAIKARLEGEEAALADAMDDLAAGRGTTRPRAELFDGAGGLFMEPVRAPRAGISVPLSIEFTERGMRLSFLTETGNAEKAAFGPTRTSKSSRSFTAEWEALPSTGIHVKAGLMAAKAKRGEYGTNVLAQIDRVQTAFNNQLEIARQLAARHGHDVHWLMQRQAELRRGLVESLMELGVDRAAVEGSITVQSYGGKDRFILRLTDEFQHQAKAKVSMFRLLRMAERAGLTGSHVEGWAEAVIRRHAGVHPDEVAALETRVRDVRRRQTEALVRELEAALPETRTPGQTRQVRETIDYLKRSLTDDSLGSLYDFIPDFSHPGSPFIGVGVVSMASKSLLDQASASSSLERLFAGQTGRITKQKHLSLMSTALLEHALNLPSPFAPPGGAASAGAYLGARTGLAAFSDVQLREELAAELTQIARQHGAPLEALYAALGSDDRGFYTSVGGSRIRLQTNPYKSALGFHRAQLALLALVTGRMHERDVFSTRLGSAHRIFDIDLTQAGATGPQGPAAPLMKGLVADDRVRARYHAEHGRAAPEGLGGDSSYVYLSRAGDIDYMIGRQAAANPLFDPRYDFMRVRLFDDSRPREAVEQALRAAGVSEARLDLFFPGGRQGPAAFLLESFGSETQVREAARRGDTAARRLLRALAAVEDVYGPSKGYVSDLYVPTLVGMLNWRDRGDFKEGALPKQVRALVDMLPRLEETAAAHERIVALAMDGSDGARAELGRLLRDETVVQGLEERHELVRMSVRTIADLVRREARQGAKRHLHGRHKIAADTFGMMRPLEELLSAYGDEDAFRAKVAELLRREGKGGLDAFDEVVDRAHKDLYRYVGHQVDEFGAAAKDIYKWHGFGIGEGFAGRSVASRAASRMAGHRDFLLQARTADNKEMIDAALAEIDRAQAAARGERGATIILLGKRDPDFQNIIPFDTTRATVLGDWSMVALGRSPSHVHTTSHPVVNLIRKQDYDYDLNWLAVLDNPMVAAEVRRDVANWNALTLREVTRVVERSKGEALWAELGLVSAGEELDIVDERGAVVGRRIVTAPRRQTSYFGSAAASSLTRGFAWAGRALAEMTSPEARELYALQKAVVGAFGSFGKQGALRMQQIENEFTHLVELVAASDPKTNPLTVEQMREMRDVASALEEMRARPSRFGPFTDAFVNMQSAIALVTQKGAIEKYKGGRAVEEALSALETLSALTGRSGSDEAFERALERARAEKVAGVDILGFFMPRSDDDIITALPEAEREAARRGQAAEAFERTARLMRRMARAAHDVSVSLGVTSGYLTFEANTNDPGATAAFMGDAATASSTGTIDGAVRQAHEADLALTRRLSHLGQLFAHGHRELDDLLGAPPVRRSLAQMLSDLPGGAKAGLAGAALLVAAGAARRETVALPAPDTPFDQVPGRLARRPEGPYSRRAVGRMAEAREKALRELAAASSTAAAPGRHYLVPPPLTDRRFYG